MVNCTKNCQIWWKFHVVVTKIILLFLRHGVFRPNVQTAPQVVGTVNFLR